METLMLNETEVQRLLDPDMLLDALSEMKWKYRDC